jgi:peptide/nickel transport system substrate-binding protein
MSDTQPDRRISRRAFLQRTLALGATLTGAALLEACAPAAAPTPSGPAAPAPVIPTVAPVSQAAATAAPTAAAAVAKTGGTLTIGYGQKTSNDHFMHLRRFAGSTAVYANTFANAKLVAMREPSKEFYPDLAEKWEFSSDNKTLTFNLRKGLKWHDGQPFTAKDVDFTIHMAGFNMGGYVLTRYLAPFVVGAQDYVDAKTDRISGLKVVDDNTVQFELIRAANRDLIFDGFNYISMAPAHILADFLKKRDSPQDILKSEWATTAKHVGLGPFKVVEYVPDQYVVYEPNPGYHFGRPKLDKLIYRSYADRQTLTAAVEKKEVDVGWIAESEWERLKKLDFLNFRTPRAMLTTGTTFNGAQPYLSDVRVRQALLHAVDRDAIIKKIYFGASEKINTMLLMAKYGESPTLTKYDFDPAKARQLLKDAGWDPNRKLRWLVQQIPSDTSIYDAINGYWSDVGVQTEFQIEPDLKSGRGKNPTFDLTWSSYPIGYPSAIASYFDSRVAESYYTGLKSDRYEQLSDQFNGPLSDEEGKKVIHEMQDILSKEARFLMICPSPNVWAINKRVRDLLPIYMASSYTDWGGLQNAWVDG